MALNKEVFRTRALSALIFVAVMLLGLLWNFWSFFILFSIIHFGCWSEFQKLIGRIDTEYTKISAFHKYGVRLAGWCIMYYFIQGSHEVSGIAVHRLAFWAGLLFVFILPVIEILFVKGSSLKNTGYSFLGLLYISVSLALLTYMSSNYFGGLFNIGKWLVILVIASIWINDTMAYIVGSLIGRTPLTRISPKKTWEGTLGGIILSVITVLLAGYFITEPVSIISVFPWAVIAAIAAVTGTFGDLLESKLKRMANVKDSGRILPGHGGFLDRFDSLLIAIPFVWVYVVIFLK